MTFITEHPFLAGLAAGLIIAVYIWLSGLFSKSALRKKVEEMKIHLNTQMEITAAGSHALLEEIKTLKNGNENLRISMKSWQQKPGRGDIRMLHLYDKALHLMLERTPGFAPVWEKVLQEAEEELRRTEKGVVPLIRRFFTPSFGGSDVYTRDIREARQQLRLPDLG